MGVFTVLDMGQAQKKIYSYVAIYLLGLAEILGVNLEREILLKMDKNEKRQYVRVNMRVSGGG